MSSQMSIATVCQTSPMGALIVEGSLDIQAAIQRFAEDHTRHGIFVVDDGGRLTGVIMNQDLLDWARLQFYLMPAGAKMAVGRVRRLLGARTIGDLAVPDSHRMSVHIDATVEEAMRTMAEFEMEDIAVVDDTGRVVNDLRLSEVLKFALQLARESPR